jgi:geranylgeranyl diphosphate synthase type II
MKTAAYSFALPLRLAGAVAQAGAPADRALARAGRDLGFAYQVQDDLLSMVGRSTAHGKDAVSDLREGKETVLVSYLRTAPQWDEVADAFGDPAIDEAEADRIRRAIEASGAREFAQDLVADRLREVVRTVDGSALPETVRRVVTACAQRIDGRTA